MTVDELPHTAVVRGKQGYWRGAPLPLIPLGDKLDAPRHVTATQKGTRTLLPTLPAPARDAAHARIAQASRPPLVLLTCVPTEQDVPWSRTHRYLRAGKAVGR